MMQSSQEWCGLSLPPSSRETQADQEFEVSRCYTERSQFTNKRKHLFADLVLCIHVCAYLFMCVSDHVCTHAYWGQRLTLGIFLNHIPTLLRQAPSLVQLDYQQISESSSLSLHNPKVPGACYNTCGCWGGSEVCMRAELAPYQSSHSLVFYDCPC